MGKEKGLDIKNVFDATACSVLTTFQSDMGVVSFSIPIYQRQYNWDFGKISRLIDDVIEGLIVLGTIPDYVTFMGTVLLIDDTENKEDSFDGKSLSIVDGQQRLTTISLVCASLYLLIKQQLEVVKDSPEDSLTTAMVEEAKLVKDLLFTCCLGRPSGPTQPELFDFFPRIIRAETDVRGDTSDVAKYSSSIAEFLFQFCEYVISNSEDNFVFTPTYHNENTDSFIERRDLIMNYIKDALHENNSVEFSFPSVTVLLNKSNYRRTLLPKIQRKDHNIKSIIDVINTNNDHVCTKLIRLVALSNFLIQRVAITKVVADDELYAFDIFEALNTTGEPLTALETFKPSVIQYEIAKEGKYKKTGSNLAFDNIEEHLSQYKDYDAQQRETRDIIVLAALYLTGEKIGYHLNEQRKYLRKIFSSGSDAAKRRIVKAIAELCKYRTNFWIKDNMTFQMRNHPEKEVALFCLNFIRDLGNSLTIPLLIRYWKKSEAISEYTEFVQAVKAVTAFLVMRRAATIGTKGIDSDYRNIMGKSCEVGVNNECILLGIEEEENSLPTIDCLQKLLKGFLKASKLSISSKDEWINRVSQQPLYNGPASLNKFILLCVAHNAFPDEEHPYLLKKGRPQSGKDFMNLAQWRSADLETIEHIAPQKQGSGWQAELYKDIDLIHYLGNLTLLPKKENASIGNKSWDKKKLFFEAIAASTDELVDHKIAAARSAGIDFGDNLIKLIKNGNCLPVVSTVAAAEHWSPGVVLERTKNIVQLLYSELSKWLGGY